MIGLVSDKNVEEEKSWSHYVRLFQTLYFSHLLENRFPSINRLPDLANLYYGPISHFMGFLLVPDTVAASIMYTSPAKPK